MGSCHIHADIHCGIHRCDENYWLELTNKNPQKIFTKPILEWWHNHGRKDLPWQKDKSPYKTWISEIMLQQTQVKTVIPYFLKFMSEYPTVNKLASAQESEVMSHWSGLGYYSRARNLHKSAAIIKKDYSGRFPQQYDQIIALPGIGPSTAGAILSLNKIEPRAIMDGNVKRVLSRHFFIEGDLSKGDLKKRMWLLSESCIPDDEYDVFTQAIMDIGATVCMPKKYKCEKCPVNMSCIAKKKNKVEFVPQKKAKKKKRKTEYNFVVIRSKDGYLMELRDSNGIWPGLWSFPVLEVNEKIGTWVALNLGADGPYDINYMDQFTHSLSHIDITINPVLIDISEYKKNNIKKNMIFFKPEKIRSLGISKAVKKIIDRL